ncbi:MAG TPA: ShlB/FhaC/HecB family hemolysin secretion/activation protein, partial [Gemmatimonadaceae bacterium]|nr:ShlB/FhaC/HecB family hemolysin secretion/activation protein [Gemmatimonadaceae bacterium]
VEERYRYERVSGTPLPSPLDSLRRVLAPRLVIADSVDRRRDSLRVAWDSMGKAERDSSMDHYWRTGVDTAEGHEREECRKTQTGERTQLERQGRERIVVLIPCDPKQLAASPDLPASIYDDSDELFGETERDQLRDWAKSLETMARMHGVDGEAGGGTRPTIEYGLGGGLARYNRIEGLSLGVRATQELTGTRTAHGLLRIGTADWIPGAELGVTSLRVDHSYDLDAYYRLAAAGDYGDPFTLGASLSALLFGRDDNFYYRAAGLELTRAPAQGEGLAWRAFVERHGNAKVRTNVSLAHIGGGKFPPNIHVDASTSYGLGLRSMRSFGLDPRGFRLLTDLRAEGAGMRSGGYGRALADLTLSHPLLFETDLAITGAAGIAGARDAVGGADSLRGVVPIEKQFFVGGPRTVRGIAPGSGVGEAFWLARAELGVGSIGFRPVGFFDMGWAGARRDFTNPGKPLAGAGVGISALDGLIRLDVAKGLRPVGGVRGYLYLDARF